MRVQHLPRECRVVHAKKIGGKKERKKKAREEKNGLQGNGPKTLSPASIRKIKRSFGDDSAEAKPPLQFVYPLEGLRFVHLTTSVSKHRRNELRPLKS